MVTETSPSTATSMADVVMLGVGRATPRAVAALAQAVELPIESVVDAVYRAPVRLFTDLVRGDAERLVEIVQSLGLQATAMPSGSAVARGALLDIAGTLVEPAQAEATAEALGVFLGTSPGAALELLLTPPGILLGNVTVSTLEALSRALPAGAVELTSAEPLTSRYALFAAKLTAVQRDILRPRLPSGVSFGADGSVTLFDLSREEADAIWRRLKATEDVRIVNQAFLRFTLYLNALPADGAATLQALAGVPVEDFPLLAQVLPVPVEHHVAYADVPARLSAYTDAGFGVKAELSTFAMVALEVLSASAEALEAAGLAAQCPFRTAPMTEPRARLLRARLEAAGADVVQAP